MQLRTVMIINAVVVIVFAIALVVVPAQLLSLYGVTADPALKYLGQLFGSALLALALVTWSARNAPYSEARSAIALGLFVGDAIGFIVALIGQLGNVVNALGWLNVAIYLVLTFGFGYYLITERMS